MYQYELADPVWYFDVFESCFMDLMSKKASIVLGHYLTKTATVQLPQRHKVPLILINISSCKLHG